MVNEPSVFELLRFDCITKYIPAIPQWYSAADKGKASQIGEALRQQTHNVISRCQRRHDCSNVAMTWLGWHAFAGLLSAFSFTSLWANSADDKLMIFLFFFFLENRIRHFMQIGDNLHEANLRQFAWNVKTRFLGKQWKIFQYVVCWKFYPQC